ncbi:MAG: NADH-quinone oxidoreductase subunit M [Magnetococcales bacterium]|nr:NADH-quinone oxidoreductase subunit M [Magnetococcales bacterium]
MSYQELLWSDQLGVPILALLQLVPLLLAILITYARRYQIAFSAALMGTLSVFLMTVVLYSLYEPDNPAMQFAEQVTLYGPIQYHAAIDGVSVIFLLLTSFLTLILIPYGRLRPMEPSWRFLALTLTIESTLISQFVTVDLLWFTMVSGLQLMLVGYLIWYWATSPEINASFVRYMQFMFVSGVLLFVGTIMLGLNHSNMTGGTWSFDLFDLVKTPAPLVDQSILFFVIFYGLSIRIPVFPFHGWLAPIIQHGTVAVAPIFLLSLKVGIFGLVRFVFPLTPEGITHWHTAVVTIAVVGVFYATLLALIQKNLRSLLAFAVISHTSILIIGLFSLGHAAFQGGVMLSINFGLAVACLFFTLGFIQNRTRTMIISRLGGLYESFPIIGSVFIIAGLSIIGMPGTPGFDAIHLILEAAIERFGAVVTIPAALGNVAAAGFLLWAFQRAFMGEKPDKPFVNPVPVRTLERLLSIVVIAVLLVTGFYSTPWFHLTDGSLVELGNLYQLTH